ncbi:MAG TPA: FAD-dependent oxidoreductase [Polyangiaceae bacterium]|jgi:CDP-4-dehydro-6-deoxyglucose reductase|nr:FAD-dependent oxidoreductase [Polyangiaceae bacterium]
MPLPPPFDARLVATRMLTPHVRELTFERTDGHPMAFEPGQWVSVTLPRPPQASEVEGASAGDIVPGKRSYSIASAPDGSPRFEVAVTRVAGGRGSAWLHALEPGIVLPFLGPHGFFTRTAAETNPAFFVGTGTGFTPLRSMLRAAIAAGNQTPVWLLFGTRREEDILYAEELRAIVREHPFVRYDVTLSQPPSSWTGRQGYVQTHVRALWEELAARTGRAPHTYVCGLTRMVGSVRDLLRKEMGLGRELVHTERYD